MGQPLGTYPPDQEAPGAVALRRLQASGGFTQDDLDAYKARTSTQLLHGGFTPADVQKYWGDDPKPTPKSMVNLADSTVRSLPPEKQADGLWEHFLAGMQDTGEGRLIHGQPTLTSGSNPTLLQTAANASGQAVASLPSFLAGASVGAPVGAVAGGAAGAFVPGAGETGGSEVAGGAIGYSMGAGAGGNVASQAFRQVVMDYQSGRIHNFDEMWHSITSALYNAKDAAIVGAAMGPLGEFSKPASKFATKYAGKYMTQVAAKRAGIIAGKTASVAAQAATGATLGAALQGRMPTQQDFMAGATVILGFEAFSHVGGKYVPTTAGSRVMNNLSQIWVKTGLTPKQALELSAHDPVLRQEILTQDPSGGEVTPNLKKVAQPDFSPATKKVEEEDAMFRKKDKSQLASGATPGGTPAQQQQDQGTGLPAAFRPRVLPPEHAPDPANYSPAPDHPHTNFPPAPDQRPNIYRPQTIENDMGAHVANTPDALLPIFRALEQSPDRNGVPQISPAGAIGRYQIMPGTARQYGFDPTKLSDPSYNENVARVILSDLHNRYHGNVDDIALAYHSGPGVANRWIAAGRPLDPKIMGPEGYKYVMHARALQGHPGEISGELPPEMQPSDEGGATGAGGPPRMELPATDLTDKEINARVDSNFAPTHNTIRDTLHWDLDNIYGQWISELGPAISFDRLMATEREHPLNTDPNAADVKPVSADQPMGAEDLFRQTYASNARASYFVREGTLSPAGVDAHGRREYTQTSDDSIMKAYQLAMAAGGDKAGLDRYQLALRTIELEGRGIKTNIRLDDAERIVKRDSVKYGDAAAMMTRVQDATLDYAREAGMFSAAQVDRIKRANMHYVTYAPMLGDRSSIPENKLPGKFTPRGGPKKIEGGDYTIDDLLNSRVKNMQTMIANADRNMAVGHIVKAIELNPDIAKVIGIRELRPQETRDIVGGEQYSAVLRDQGLTMDPAGSKPMENGAKPADARPLKSLIDGMNIDWTKNATRFPYYDDGKLRVFEVEDPEIASLFRGGAGELNPNVVTTIATKLAHLQRSGVTFDPSYGLRMTLRHEFTSTIFDKNGGWFPFQDLARGFLHVVKQDDFYKKVWANGGMSGTMQDLDRDYLKRDVNAIMEGTGTNSVLWNTFRHPMLLVEALHERANAMARVGYAARLNKSEGILKASTDARTAKIDFAEKTASPLANTIARMIPFQRARVLGMKQQYEAFTQRPLQTIFKLMLFSVIPAAVLHVINRQQDESGTVEPDEQYNQLNRFERDTNLITPQIDGVRMKLLAAPGIATMTNALVNRTMDAIYDQDPHAYKQLSTTLLNEFSPASMPTIATPFLEATTNTDWLSGHPLVPDSMKQASGPMQYKENTTAVARKLGQIIGETPLDQKVGDVIHTSSPVMIDKLVQDWSGTIGMSALGALNYPLTGHFRSDARPASIFDTPFVQSFFITHNTNPQAINDFYDSYDKLQEAHQDRLAAAREMVETGDQSAWRQYGGDPAAYMSVARIQRAMKFQEQTIEAINHNDKMTVDEKRQAINTVTSAWIATARYGTKMIDGILKARDH